jgi:KDO2-lipid IV(A) lauroyltransferase
MRTTTKNKTITFKDRAEYVLVMSVLIPLAFLPHRWRVPLAGQLLGKLLGPILGWRKRIGKNLDLAMPDLPKIERQRLMRDVPDNLGRLFIELLSPFQMRPIASAARYSGLGIREIEAAMTRGRAIVCVSGHFGNYDVCRSALVQRGFDVGALYRPMNNRLFNKHYESSILAVGGTMFPRSRRGMSKMVTHLRKGGLLMILVDQHMHKGASLTFFGQPAKTALSAAQMALKYDALLVPIYAVRQADGLSFEIEVEASVPSTDAETMTQALNNSLEAKVRAHPEQWLWTHRRWKESSSEQLAEENGV